MRNWVVLHTWEWEYNLLSGWFLVVILEFHIGIVLLIYFYSMLAKIHKSFTKVTDDTENFVWAATLLLCLRESSQLSPRGASIQPQASLFPWRRRQEERRQEAAGSIERGGRRGRGGASIPAPGLQWHALAYCAASELRSARGLTGLAAPPRAAASLPARLATTRPRPYSPAEWRRPE